MLVVKNGTCEGRAYLDSSTLAGYAAKTAFSMNSLFARFILGEQLQGLYVVLLDDSEVRIGEGGGGFCFSVHRELGNEADAE